MKVKGLCLLALIVLCVASVQARKEKGNGRLVTKSISVSDYTAVKGGNYISGNGGSWFSWFSEGSHSSPVFKYEQGKRASLEVTIDENLFPLLDIRVKDGWLLIGTDGTYIQPTKLEFHGVSRDLQAIEISHGMDFVLVGPLSGSELNVSASGGSDVEMKHRVRMTTCEVYASGGSDVDFDDLECVNFKSECSGGSDMSIKGKADKAQVRASGGSDFSGYGFRVKDLACRASGGSDCQVYAEDKLDASASGGSDIYYKGPADVTSSESGGSDVSKAG